GSKYVDGIPAAEAGAGIVSINAVAKTHDRRTMGNSIEGNETLHSLIRIGEAKVKGAPPVCERPPGMNSRTAGATGVAAHRRSAHGRPRRAGGDWPEGSAHLNQSSQE